MNGKFTKTLFFLGISFLFLPFFVRAGELEFNIDPSYDISSRSKITAFLHQIGVNAYFYVEDDYYKKLDVDKRKLFTDALQGLSQEFDQVIYPQLTKTFGFEWKPGIDRDDKITILITQIKEDSGGYFNQGDEYPRAQVPSSNEREMLYLNANYIVSPLAKSYLGHEFVHLITFNQKYRNFGVNEETWLNEARAEIALTFLGYDNDFLNSNLQRRVKTFIQKPDDPLAEWRDANSDYSVVNIFSQYLYDHYGIRIFSDSLLSGKIGIPSINEALQKNGFSDNFSRIFTNWLITLLVNDCNVGAKYCYLNPNLKNLRIIPQLNYLPLAGESSLSLTDYIKNWQGSWYKFIGGKGTLKLEFIGQEIVNFEVPYLVRDTSGNYSVSFLNLSASQRGTVYINDFGTKYDSLIIIPSLQHKLSGFNGIENYYQFIWTASVINGNSNKAEEQLIQGLLSQIAFLQQEIAKVQAQINNILAKNGGSPVFCQKLERDLYYGIANSQEVRCLQEFLKLQGAAIYPEGIVSGNFLALTQNAVIRFQEKYASEILAPLGLGKGTGYVGALTRAKINTLSGK